MSYTITIDPYWHSLTLSDDSSTPARKSLIKLEKDYEKGAYSLRCTLTRATRERLGLEDRAFGTFQEGLMEIEGRLGIKTRSVWLCNAAVMSGMRVDSRNASNVIGRFNLQHGDRVTLFDAQSPTVRVVVVHTPAGVVLVEDRHNPVPAGGMVPRNHFSLLGDRELRTLPITSAIAAVLEDRGALHGDVVSVPAIPVMKPTSNTWCVVRQGLAPAVLICEQNGQSIDSEQLSAEQWASLAIKAEREEVFRGDIAALSGKRRKSSGTAAA